MTRLEDDTRLPRAGADIAPEERALMACRDCGARFPRSEVGAPEKGSLACPECGSQDIADANGEN